MSKLAFFLMGLCFAAGIVVGVLIDKDYYIRGKVKQKGKGNIQDITSTLNIDKKQARKQKRLLKKSK